MRRINLSLILLFLLFSINLKAQTIISKNLPKDTDGKEINAHGGGILKHQGTYYWFGEKRGKQASEGVNVYSSKDLIHWKFEDLALKHDSTESDIQWGSIMERPKVLYNKKTQQFVMWFHLELKGQGYKAARAGVAVSQNITGPYHYIGSTRPNGNMSRDMTLYQDDDDKAYLIYSSRENYDMRAVLLSDDYLSVTSADSLLSSNHREAPAIFKYQNKYYLITSACTGWKPNAANMYVADHIFGPWKEEENPMKGQDAELTFGGQSTYVLPLNDKQNKFLFIADEWNPNNLTRSKSIWLPITLKNDALPSINWQDSWNLKSYIKK